VESVAERHVGYLGTEQTHLGRPRAPLLPLLLVFRDVPGVSSSLLPGAWGLKSVLHSTHRRAAARTLSSTVSLSLSLSRG